ncbi:class I adenylate-forming enzyme family protein [Natronosalvus amylolyticus]|uniref:class I adenylate-forming enzyme family protein n=1 Tax=Natronosalvus amylolyticus TaxID=2961994 RepID=UPI0020C9D9E3|nr:class I adenylate-forming enzyme family protein [Natronosalvus amylolyticus]
MAYNFDLGVADPESFVEQSSRFSIGDQLRKTARMYPDRRAVVDLERDRTVRYATLDERVDKLASGLLEHGLEPNESTVAVLAENRGETVEVAHACARTGTLIATLNWRLEREELVHCIDLADPDFLVVSDRFEDRLDWVDADAESDPITVGYDGGEEADLDFVSVRDGGDPSDPRLDITVGAEQGFAIINTSGTTGLPKGAVVSHRAEMARAIQVILDYELERGDNYPAWGPMFHMAGLDWIVVTAVLCGTYYPIDGFEPASIVDAIRDSSRPISWLFLVPGVLERMWAYIEDEGVDPTTFPPIRTMGSLPDMIEPARIERITDLFDAPFQNTYGSTEVGHSASGSKLPVGESPTEASLSKVESPFGNVRLVDENMAPATDDHGEMIVSGPALFSGYVDNPDANEEVFVDGWYRTGDIFERHEDGTYSYLNRRKYLIKPGGENVYPAELEGILIEHEAVEEVVVVRADDPQWGEVPRAVIGTTETDDPEGLREALYDRLEAQLAGYKLPKYLEFVEPEQFPRSTTGKIVRTDVEEWERGQPIEK